MAWSVYILRSVADGRTYVGFAEDTAARLLRHNRGQVAATRRGRPWVLLHTEDFADSASAIRRERYLKSGAGRRWMAEHLFGQTARLPAPQCGARPRPGPAGAGRA